MKSNSFNYYTITTVDNETTCVVYNDLAIVM